MGRFFLEIIKSKYVKQSSDQKMQAKQSIQRSKPKRVHRTTSRNTISRVTTKRALYMTGYEKCARKVNRNTPKQNVRCTKLPIESLKVASGRGDQEAPTASRDVHLQRPTKHSTVVSYKKSVQKQKKMLSMLSLATSNCRAYTDFSCLTRNMRSCASFSRCGFVRPQRPPNSPPPASK